MFSPERWQEVVDQCVKELTFLDLPLDPLPSQIMELNSRLDALQARLRLQHVQLKAELGKLQTVLKVYSKVYYLDVKDEARTEKEREALVYKRLLGPEHYYNGLSLFDAISTLEEQVAYLDTVISIVSSRAQRVITTLGALKLEHSLTAPDSITSRAMAQ